MAGNAANLNTGPCWVRYGATDLGYTKGGVKIEYKAESVDIEVDQETNPVDVMIKATDYTVSVPLAEYTLENLNLAFPGSEIVTDKTTPTKKKLLLNDAAGLSMYSLAKELVLHPKGLPPEDPSKDWTFSKAVPVGDVEISYDKENVKTITLMFRTFPAAGVLGAFGDKSATAV